MKERRDSMQQLGMGQAVNQALREEMARDPEVFVAGEGFGVSIHASPMLPLHGLLEEFGPARVKDTPVSEAAIAGLAVGRPKRASSRWWRSCSTPFSPLLRT